MDTSNADQRYYASTYGRFNTADKSTGSARLGIPGSWNRYAYVGGDPINLNDPSGLDPYCGPGLIWDGEGCTDGPGGGSPPSGCFVACEPPPPDPDPGPDPGPGPSPSPGSSPPPCNPGNSTVVANNLQFLVTNWDAAEALSIQYLLPADWILGWASLESSATSPGGNLYGKLAQASNGDNNYLGQTAKGWAGQTPCPVAVTNSSGFTFACFASFSADVNAALASRYGAILQSAENAGESAQQAFTAVYLAGWNQSTAAASGALIQSTITNHIDPMLDCLAFYGLLH